MNSIIYKCKKAFSLLIIIYICFILVSCNMTIDFNYLKENMTLSYKENFKILQLSDIQVNTTNDCINAFDLIDKLVVKSSPNLIVLTGDNFSYPQNYDVIKLLISKLDNYYIPWTAVFGNHDGEGVFTNQQISILFNESKHCIFKNTEDEIYGDSNFTIQLKDKNEYTKYILFFFDSNSYRTTSELSLPVRFAGNNTVYDYIHEDQIAWYEKVVNDFTNNNITIPSLAFFHIPLPEYKNAITDFNKGLITGRGVFREEVCPAEYNSGLFEKIKELKSTKAIFCGHEHINTCDLLYQDIHLVYGLKSSRCSYYNEDLLGGTLITLRSSQIDINNISFD